MSKRYNICLPVNKSNQQTTLSHETGIFRGKLAKFAGKMLAQREIMRTFVVSELHIGTANKQVKEIEGIGSSIIIRSYILGICGSDRLGLCRTAFLFNSSNSRSQMKQTTTAAGTTTVPASVKAGTIYSWATLFAIVMNLKNRLPKPWRDVIPVENVNDLKTVVKLSVILLAVFLMAGIYDMFLLQEGGAL